MRATPLFLLLIAGLASLPAQAAQKEWRFSIDEKTWVDSNPGMVASGARDLYISALTPEIAFASKTPTSRLLAESSVTQNFANLDGYRTTDLRGKLELGRSTEKWEAALAADGAYDTTHAGELTTLGLANDAVRRTSWHVAPSLSYKPSLLDRVTLTPSYTQVGYDSLLYTDYHIASATLDYARQLTDKHSLLMAGSVQRYQADENNEKRIDSYSPTVGFLSALSAQLTLRVTAGVQASQEKGGSAPDTDWEWSSVYQGALTFKGEQHTTALTIARSQQPYVDGNEDILTSVKLSEAYKLSPLVSVSFDGAYHRGASKDKRPGALKDRWEAGPRLTYRVMPNLDAFAGYRYRREDVYDREQAAQGHTARLGFKWNM